MLVFGNKTLSEYIIRNPTSFCLLYRSSELFQLLAPFPLSSNIPAKLSEKMVTGEETLFLLGPVGCCPHGWYSSQGLSAGREAGSLAPSLLRHRVPCHSPSSKACKSSAPLEGLLQNYYFRGFADLGSHSSSKSHTGRFLFSIWKLGCLNFLFLD